MIKRFTTNKPLVEINVFKSLLIQVGSIKQLKPITKAKKPSFEMDGSFGTTGNKKSCGQFMRNYKPDELLNKKILGLTNFAPVKIAGIKSEYLTLGFPDENEDGQAIALTPCIAVDDGTRVVVDTCFKETSDQIKTASYDTFESIEVKSATIIDIITTSDLKISYCVVDFDDNIQDLVYVPGKLCGNKSDYIGIQIPVVTNLNISEFKQDIDDVKLVAMVVPVNTNVGEVTFVKIDKKVRNNRQMF